MKSTDFSAISIPVSERVARLSRVHIAVTVPVAAVTLIPFIARLYVRTHPVVRLGWDDALVIVGFVRHHLSFCPIPRADSSTDPIY
jgi:hypothetical protein